MPAIDGFREVAVLAEGPDFRLIRAADDGGDTVLIKTSTRPRARSELIASLRREFELEKGLRHAALVEPLQLVDRSHQPALVLADGGGSTLREVLRSGALPVRQAVAIGVGIASGLAELHRNDVVHRDLRPDSIMIGADGATARIVDLGAATLVPRQQAALLSPGVEIRKSLRYIAPEQTGRTSRPVDYHADLYSLGVILFEMLCGAPPFTSDAPLELVHDHLAVPAPRVSRLNEGVPRRLTDLVARLLEKDPEDRYRSATGAQQDLEHIHDHLLRGLDPDELELAGAHISTRFQVPDGVFGRSQELAEMESWLHRSARGSTSLLFVHGEAGVGKTRLVDELRTTVNQLRGYLAVGKTDQAYRGLPYGSLAAALQMLTRRLLTEEDEQIAAHRARLQAALGAEASVLAELVPSAAELIGPRPPRFTTPQTTAGDLDELLMRFLATVAETAPVVIELEDLHRADVPTIRFLGWAMEHRPTHQVLFVATYRDEEIGEAHAVRTMQHGLEQRGITVGDIRLAPLEAAAVGELVAASVGRTVGDAAPLAEVCARRAQGNPLATRLLLQALYENQLLQLDPASGAWSWDLDAIEPYVATDQASSLAAQKISGLSESARALLGVLGLVGSEGDTDLLIEIGINDPAGRLQELAAADIVELAEEQSALRWAFAHDRFQETANSLIEDADRPSWHLRIGEALQRRRGGLMSMHSIFAVLRHFNAAWESHQSKDRTLAALNLEGGRSAMRATDYAAARDYFTTGIAVLGNSQWHDQADLAFSLHIGAADAARQTADYEDMLRFAEIIASSTTDPTHLVEARLRNVLYLSQTGVHAAAVEEARTALAEIGWSFPQRPSLRHVAWQRIQTRLHLARLPARSVRIRGAGMTKADFNEVDFVRIKSIQQYAGANALQPSSYPEWLPDVLVFGTPTQLPPTAADDRTSYIASSSIFRILELPATQNVTGRQLMQLISEAIISAYWTDPNTLALMTLKGVDLSLMLGVDQSSPLCFALYGARVSAVDGNPEEGLAYGDVALRMARTLGTLSKPGRVRFVRDVLVAPSRVPLREIQPSLHRAHRAAMDSGDVSIGTSALLYAALHALLAGAPLDAVEEAAANAETQLRDFDQRRNLEVAMAMRQLVHDLRFRDPDAVPFTGPFHTGSAIGADTSQPLNGSAACWVRTLGALGRWHAGDIAGARSDIAAAETKLGAVAGQAVVPMHHLLGALTGARSSERGSARRRAVRIHRRRLAWFARHNPVQYEAFRLLADGAIAAGRGRLKRGLGLLGDAMRAATEHENPMITAMAAALAADIAEQQGDRGAAQRHRNTADAARLAWGATAPGDSNRAGAPPADAIRTSSDDLDLATVVEAAEAISEQIQLDALLQVLLKVVLQNAGADHGLLFRFDGDDVVPEAEGHVDADEGAIQVRLLGPTAEVAAAHSVVRLVARTAEPLIVPKAANDPLLSVDPSVQQRGVRSVLCLPLMAQGRLHGILYLENNQADGAFTPSRQRLLGILSAQAASALEKARLHEAQRKLIAAQDRFVPAQFLKALGHSSLTDVDRGEGTLKVVDILFTDIRSFTSIVEDMSPADAMAFVNEYLAHMEPVVSAHGGFVDTYDGDSILALFDAGTDAGVKAAIAMSHAEAADNQRRSADGQCPVHTGFGINTAGVMMGIVGGVDALRATIIGDAVNVASRIESLTKRYATRMLISENTAVRLRSDTMATLRPLERVRLVGKTQPLQVFEVLDALDPNVRRSRLQTLDLHNEAIAAYEQGDFETACRLFARVLELDPGDTPVGVMLSQANELRMTGGLSDGPPITHLDAK